MTVTFDSGKTGNHAGTATDVFSDDDIIRHMARNMVDACLDLYHEDGLGRQIGPNMSIEARKIFAAIRAYEQINGKARPPRGW